MAKRIIDLMPPHTRYCEPYAGGLAVLFAKPCEGVAEFVNDLNGALVNFWRVLRDDAGFERFKRIIDTVPLSQPDFDVASYGMEQSVSYSVHNAVDFFIRYRQSRQGLGKDFCTPTSRTRRGMNENVSAWLSAVEGLPEAHARLKRVEIRCMEAVDFIKELDSPETCFYVDCPYLHETRASTGEYEHEMTEEQHRALLHILEGITGKFLLSGYPSKLYERFELANNWHRVDFAIDNKASARKSKEQKTECVWMNY